MSPCGLCRELIGDYGPSAHVIDFDAGRGAARHHRVPAAVEDDAPLGVVVETVLGPVDPAALGAVSMHEHLVSDASALVPGATLDDPDLAARELALAAAAGLGTVVDPTVWGFGGPSPALPEIARAAGVHVIAGAGAYLGRPCRPGCRSCRSTP